MERLHARYNCRSNSLDLYIDLLSLACSNTLQSIFQSCLTAIVGRTFLSRHLAKNLCNFYFAHISITFSYALLKYLLYMRKITFLVRVFQPWGFFCCYAICICQFVGKYVLTLESKKRLTASWDTNTHTYIYNMHFCYPGESYYKFVLH